MNRKRRGDPISGWIIVDKPKGIGSTNIVSIIKRLTNAQKVGHAGTLDPLASGVLPIALGEATKTISYVMDGVKTYEFGVKWGQSTTTDDEEGEIVQTTDTLPTLSQIESILPSFIGDIDQVPPKFSAVHVDGKRAYDLARENKTVILSSRRIRIDDLKIIDMPSADQTYFEVTCGKGTYVRSLARDMAEKIGSLGHICHLRRVRCGKFLAQNAFSLEYLDTLGHILKESKVLLPVRTVLDDIPALALTQAEASKLSNGGFLPVQADFEQGQILQAVLDDQLVALVRVWDDFIRPVRVIV